MEQDHEGLSRRAKGLLLAGAFSVVAGSVVSYFVLTEDAAPPPDDRFADIEAIRIGEGSSDVEGDGLRIEIERNDDAALRAVFLADRLDPADDDGFRPVERPNAYISMDDGRVVHIEGDRGRFFMPDANSEPEAGTLSGNVRITMYPSRSGSIRDSLPNPDAESPELVATFDEPLSYDMRTTRVSTPGRVVITSDGVEFAGRGLTAVLNEVRQRIETLVIEEGESITLLGSQNDTGDESTRESSNGETEQSEAVARTDEAGSQVASADQAVERTEQDEPPKIDLYRAAFEQSVVVHRGSQTIAGDRLDIWVRLIDNRLAVSVEPDEQSEPSDDNASVSLANASDAQGDTETDSERGSADDPEGEPVEASNDAVTVTWSGPMTLAPVDADAVPAELTGEDLTMRMTAPHTGVVRFGDAANNQTGVAEFAEVRVTQQQVELRGNADTAIPDVRLAAGGSGAIAADLLELDVAQGVAHVPGPGRLVQLGTDRLATGTGNDDAQSVASVPQTAAAPNSISWSDDATFRFAVIDGEMTSDLESADFTGFVRARAEEGMLDASEVSALFGDVGLNQRQLTRMVAEDAWVRGLNEDTLRAETMTLELAGRDEADAVVGVPTRLLANGRVQGESGGQSLESDTLEVLLDETEGQVEPQMVFANGNVTYIGTDGQTALAARLEADPVAEYVMLWSDGALPASVATGGTSIEGPFIELDGARNRGVVEGSGSVHSRSAPDEASGGFEAIVTATWSERMTFDDNLGVIEVTGDITGESRPDAVTVETFAGDFARIVFLPTTASEGPDSVPETSEELESDTNGSGIESETNGDDAAPFELAEPSTRREISTIDVRGGADGSAIVESRKFVDPAHSDLERLMYFQSERFVVNDPDQKLETNTPGRLLIVNRATDMDSNQRVQALLTWQDRMFADRSNGYAEAEGSSELTHRRLADDLLTQIDADRVSVRFVETGTAAATPVAQTVDVDAGAAGSSMLAVSEITAANAWGNVYFRSGGKELTAAVLDYDAIEGEAIAEANTGDDSPPGPAVVTYRDNNQSGPLRALRLRWDLVRDRIEILRPAPASAGGS